MTKSSGDAKDTDRLADWTTTAWNPASVRSWNARIRHTTAMLEHFRVGAKEQAEVLAFLAGSKADIVEKQ